MVDQELNTALMAWSSAGLEPDPEMLHSILTSTAPSRDPAHRSVRNAIVHFAGAEWRYVISSSRQLAKTFLDGLGMLWAQGQMNEEYDEAAGDRAYLAMRRYLHFHSCSLSDIGQISEIVRSEERLPRASAVPFSERVPRAKGTCDRFLHDLECLINQDPICERKARDSACEKCEAPFEDFSPSIWSRFSTTGFSCLDPLRPIALEMLREMQLVAADAHATIEDVRCAALAGIVMLYGFDYRDALRLRVGADPGRGPGAIDLAGCRLIRALGNGYYPRGRAFGKSTFALPIPADLLALLIRSTTRTTENLPLEEAWSRSVKSAYAGRLASRIRAWQPRMGFRSIALQHTFDAAALYRIGLYPVQLSILRGTPLYGAGAECDYITATSRQLVDWWTRVHEELRQWAG